MKSVTKRLIAVLCCVVLLVTSLYITEPQEVDAAGTVGTLTITSERSSIPINAAGELNLGYSTDVADYGNFGDDFLTAAFIEQYVTFGGGMTSADLMNGKHQFVIANGNTLQFNWNQRSTAFTEGWSFTIAQGAPISYRTSANGNPIAYLALAKEYTFTFQSGDATYGNYVQVTGCYVEEFSLGALTLWGNGLQGTSEIYFANSLTKTPGAYTYKEMQNDAAYADYISIANKKFEDLAGDVKIQYIVSDGAQCFQFLDWGSLRTTMTSGERIIFYKGLPIYYTDTSGAACRAVLDATYIYQCMGPMLDTHDQTFLGVKLDDTTTYGLNTNTTGRDTWPQGSEQYVNLWFDAPISLLSSHLQREMLTDSIVDDYIQISNMTLEQAKELGMAIRFIPYVADMENGCLQVAFGEELVKELEVGDEIVLKEGMPVVYENGGVMYAATLDKDYVITVNANDGTTLNVSYTLADTYSLSGSVNGPGVDEDKNYYDIRIESDAFADVTSDTQGSFGEVWKDYVTLSKHTVADFTADNARMNWYLHSGFKAVRPYTDLTFVDGEVLMIKKGLPFTYTNTGGKAKTVYLDKDYGFVYDASTMKFTYDPTLGNEEIQEGPQVFDFNGTDFDTTVDSTEGHDALQKANVAVLLTDTSAVPESYTDSVYGGGSNHYASVPVDFGKPIDLSKVTSVKVRMYIPIYSPENGTPVFRLLTNEATGSGVTYAEVAYENIGGVFGKWCEVDITDMLKSSSTVKDEEGYLGRFIIAFRTRGAVTCYFDYISIEGTDYFVSEDGTFKDVTIEKIGANSAFNTTSSEWDIYPIPSNPAKVPGTESVTKFDVVYEIGGVEYSGTFTRSDDTNGLYLTIPVENLAADADGVFVTIKAGEYASSGTSAGINITDDYVIYIYNGVPNQYEGDVFCETDSDTYTVSEADTVQIDGETYELGDEYAKSGSHVLTYTVDGGTYAKRLAIYRIGDISDDGDISAIDLVAIKKRIAGKREVSMSGMEAADMDIDDVVTVNDTNLLRKYLVTEQGVLVLTPREGNTVANASEAAEGLIVDYYYEKSELYKTGEDIYHRDITILKWLSLEDVATYTVALATTEDMSDRVLYQTTDCSLKLMNLLASTDYYWTVTAGEFVSPIQTFHTADTIRTITVEGVSNTRDGGGWLTVDDKVVKQGMFYRGGKLDDITASGLTVMNEQLGIKTDMDLRNSSETDGASSPLGGSVQYVNYSGPYYWGEVHGINAEAYREALVNEIRTFADAENYPIYVHCSLGRDRTGTICFLINALLGVSKEDLYLDYEFSLLSVTGTMDNAPVHALVVNNFGAMYDQVKAYAPNGTMAEATEAFMISIGVTQAEINMIRQLLLQDQ